MLNTSINGMILIALIQFELSVIYFFIVYYPKSSQKYSYTATNTANIRITMKWTAKGISLV